MGASKRAKTVPVYGDENSPSPKSYPALHPLWPAVRHQSPARKTPSLLCQTGMCAGEPSQRAQKMAEKKRRQDLLSRDGYHTGPVAVSRMQDWRKEHPHYWRRIANAAATANAGPRDLPTVLKEFFRKDSCDALQDSWPPQVVAFVGLIAWLRGDALQDTIAADIDEIMVTGNDLLLAMAAAAPNRKPQTITNEP